MAPPTFTTLPAEARQIIFKYVMPKEVCMAGCPCKSDPDSHSDKVVLSHFQRVSQALRNVRDQRPKLLLVSKQVNAELTTLPGSSSILKFCHQECARRWMRYKLSADAAMVGGIEIDSYISVTAFVFQTRKGDLSNEP